MTSNKRLSDALRQKLQKQPELYKKTLMLACGLILLCLMLSLPGCSNSSQQVITTTEYRYLGPGTEMVRDMPMPEWHGGSNQALLKLLETVVKNIEVHNQDQDALRQGILEAQELDQ